jgi:hypothetical protein
MTQLTQTRQRPISAAVAGVALAAAVVGGIVGGGIQAVVAGRPAAVPAVDRHAQAVLDHAIAWEARYRQMYPNAR